MNTPSPLPLPLPKAPPCDPRQRRRRAVARHLRGRARDGAARLSMGGASGSVQLPKVVTAVTTSSALVRRALVSGVCGWRRVRRLAVCSPSSSAGVLALVTLGARGLDRRAVDALVSDAQAWVTPSCERDHSVLPAGVPLSAGVHLGVSDPSAPTGADCSLSGPLQPHTAPLTLSLPGSGAASLPNPWRAP
jgi:hypothetical protein